MESESSRDGSVTDSDIVRSAKSKKQSKDDFHTAEKHPIGTPHSASSKLMKRALFPSTPASYSDDDSCQGFNRKKKRKYTSESRDKQATPSIHLSERQQVLLLKTYAAENSPKPSSPAFSTSSQGPYSASSGTDRIHRRNNRGETLLHIAAHRGEIKHMLELIEQGLDVNALDNADWTPLHEACNKGHVDAAKVLLDHGAFVNAKGDEDITPLHDAAGSGSVQLVKLLLERGADPNSADKTGKCPFEGTESPAIIKEIKAWPTYVPVERKINKSSESNSEEFSNVESPRLNSAADVITDDPQLALTSSNGDSSLTKTNVAPISSKLEAKQNSSTSDDQSSSLPGNSASNNSRDGPGTNIVEENPTPPLLSPQLPDDESGTFKSEMEGSITEKRISSPPPPLESAVTKLPQLEVLASSPPLVVITESGESGNKTAKSEELLLQVCTKPTQDEGREENSFLKTTISADESKNSGSLKQEPTVASCRARRKVTSKEAPGRIASPEDRSKHGLHRKRLGSMGGISPANRDSNSSTSADSGQKVQPLRKRLVKNEEDKDERAHKERKKVKDRPAVDQECAQHPPDPYEFNEENGNALDATVHQLAQSTPASPRSGHQSPASKNTSQSSPLVSSVKVSRRNRGKRPSSPLTPNEMKLPPLKIRLNRGSSNPLTETSRQSESESSASNMSAVKVEAEEEEQSRTETEIKSEPPEVKNDKQSVPPRKRKVRGSGSTSPMGLLSVSTNVGYGGSPVISPSSQFTQEQFAHFLNTEKPRIPNYISQYRLARKWVAEKRRQNLTPAQLPSLPRGVGDFMMIRKNYMLAADGGQQIISGITPNQESQPIQPPSSLALNTSSNSGSSSAFSSVLPPQQQPSPTLPPSLQALFRSQEENRNRVRIQHRVEQEKLVLCYEQEIFRAYVHREMQSNQAQPLSACAYLSEPHSACRAPPEAIISTSSSTSSSTNSNSAQNNDSSAQQRAMRLTARHQRPKLDDLDEKFSKLADALLQRHRHEAAAMRAVQAAEWEWRNDIVQQMAGDSPPSESSNLSSFQVSDKTVPVVSVPQSLSIPRSII